MAAAGGMMLSGLVLFDLRRVDCRDSRGEGLSGRVATKEAGVSSLTRDSRGLRPLAGEGEETVHLMGLQDKSYIADSEPVEDDPEEDLDMDPVDYPFNDEEEESFEEEEGEL
ncbi:hypothetical protein Tco_1089831 [Tanacetum coccineum]